MRRREWFESAACLRINGKSFGIALDALAKKVSELKETSFYVRLLIREGAEKLLLLTTFWRPNAKECTNFKLISKF